jgi:uncharacterized protein
MRILMTGASGLVGTHLCKALTQRGDTVVAVSRHPHTSAGPITWMQGASDDSTFLARAMKDCDAVVNLAGASIAQRWTTKVRRQIMASRQDTTSALCSAMATAEPRPKTFVTASAVGYYGTDPLAVFDESAPAGEGFLADVAVRWEDAAKPAEALGVRVVFTRFGVILAREGGALKPMALPVRGFVGGQLGDGRQWISWVHIIDVVNMVLLALDNPEVRGPINVVAPGAESNAALTKAIGETLNRPVWTHVPKFVLKMMLGETADEVLLNGQHVLPKRAEALGYAFRFPALKPALADLLGDQP